MRKDTKEIYKAYIRAKKIEALYSEVVLELDRALTKKNDEGEQRVLYLLKLIEEEKAPIRELLENTFSIHQ